jgi:hypothetical protein
MFKCENGHASLEGGFCDECGSQMFKQDSDVAVAVTSSTECLDVNLGEISRTVGTSDVSSVALTVDSGKQILDTHGNGSSTYAELQALTDVVHQQNRNEDTLRQLCENIMADNFVTREEWIELQSLRPTVTEQTWAKYMMIYNITEPKVFSAPDQIGTLYWRVTGVLQARCSCILEFRVSDLTDNLAVLDMTFSGSPNEFHWSTTFTPSGHDFSETTWTPQTHGLSLVTISGVSETQDEILRIGTQRSIRLQVGDPERVSTTVIHTNTVVAGEVGTVKTFGVPNVPGFLANKGKQPAQMPESEWNGLPLVIKKREPKPVHIDVPETPPSPVLDLEREQPTEKEVESPQPVEEDKSVQIIPAKGLSPRPYTILGPNNSDVMVFFGERLVLGRISDSATVDPMEQLGIACYLSNGDDDLESTKAISRKTVVIEHAGNMVAARNIGRSALIIDDVPVKYEQDVYLTLGQHSTITVGANARLQEGLKPATLSCQIIAGVELEVSLQDAFRAFDDTFLVLNKQPGALVISQSAGKDTLRTLWITGAVTLAELTGMRRKEYENIIVFRHASRLWLQDRSRQAFRVLELSHQSLAELVSGFQVTQD